MALGADDHNADNAHYVKLAVRDPVRSDDGALPSPRRDRGSACCVAEKSTGRSRVRQTDEGRSSARELPLTPAVAREVILRCLLVGVSTTALTGCSKDDGEARPSR